MFQQYEQLEKRWHTGNFRLRFNAPGKIPPEIPCRQQRPHPKNQR